MLRCKEGAGRFRVSLRVNHQAAPYRVQIHGHHALFARNADGSLMVGPDGTAIVVEEAPWAGVDEPYEGELCAHELQWLGGVPGKEWRPEYLWTIEKVA